MIGKELGNYRIIAPIGEGNHGVVYLAEHRLLDSRVALKRFGDPIAGDRKLRQHVVIAARTAAKCRHPNLVTVFDLIDTDKHLAVAMELLEGESLAGFLKTASEPAPLAETWRLLKPVLDAVAFAHSQGVVHGGLRPDNFLLAQHGGHTIPKVTDLGLPGSFAEGSTEGSAEESDDDVATWLHYAAPEQHADAGVLTPAVDIFALGVVLFETLTCTRPFHEDNANALVHAIRTRRAPNLRSVRPDLSHALEDVVMRALELTPSARWPDCRELAAALEAAMAAPSPATAPAPMVPMAAPTMAAAPVPQVGAPQPVPYAAPAPPAQQPQAPVPYGAPAPPHHATQPTHPPRSSAANAAAPTSRRGHRPPLGRTARQAALQKDPVLASMEPKSVARDKWIIAATVGTCLIALVVAMIVAVTSEERKSPSTSGTNANTNANRGIIATPPRTPPKDAGAVAKVVNCEHLRGNWSGIFHAGRNRLAHNFTGTVQGTKNACQATFRITTGRRGYVIQYFAVTISGSRVTFRGTRVDRSMSPFGYSRDTFVGHLNVARTKFSGRVRDAKGVIGTVQMQKK